MKSQKLNVAALEQFAGPWMLSEERIKALFARLRDARADIPDDDDGGCEPAPASYRVQNGVAIFDICGTLTKYPIGYGWDEALGLCPTTPIMDAVNRAANDWMVRSLNFVIDSPGGMVAGTNQLAELIAKVNRKKSCYATVSDLAASGGYYLASQCRSISCNAMGEVGCIGVYTVLADWSKFYDEFGVKLTVVSSGGVKGLGADGVVSQELIDDQRRGIMGMYEKFIADVASGRGITLDEARKLGDGRCWIAPEALKLGLIDSVSSVDSAIAANIQETQTMNTEAFRAYAAANPEAAEVKELIAKGFGDGKKAGIAEAHQNEITRAKEIAAVCDGDYELAFNCFVAGESAATAKLAADAAAKAKAQAKAVADAHAAALAEKDKEIERLKFEANGRAPVAQRPSASESAPAEVDGDPKAIAKGEWEKMSATDKQRYVNEDVYVRARVRELAQQQAA